MANRRRAPKAHFTSHAKPRATPGPNARPAPNPQPAPRRFVPVPRYQRSDGWTAEAQVAFIEALAQSGCITEACKAVGKSRASVYRLRADPQAASFRIAWENALDVAVRRIADNAYSRALHGVVTPIFYQGEQIGERVRHDERLVMFLLRYRDPLHYGRAQDRVVPDGHLESAAARLRESLEAVEEDAARAEVAAEAEEEVMADLAREEAEEAAAEQAALRAQDAARAAPSATARDQAAQSVRSAHAGTQARASVNAAVQAVAKPASQTSTQAAAPTAVVTVVQISDAAAAAVANHTACEAVAKVETGVAPEPPDKAAARTCIADGIGCEAAPADAPIVGQTGGETRTGAIGDRPNPSPSRPPSGADATGRDVARADVQGDGQTKANTRTSTQDDCPDVPPLPRRAGAGETGRDAVPTNALFGGQAGVDSQTGAGASDGDVASPLSLSGMKKE